MLSRAVAVVLVAFGLPVMTATAAVADDPGCPAGTAPVKVDGGVICIVVTNPGNPGTPAPPVDDGHTTIGCFKGSTEVPCVTDLGTWWPGHQCYAAPYDAPPGTPAWQGHTDGSLWQCTACDIGATAGTCNVQIIWTAPGEEPGPPTPDELATTAIGLMPLAKAEIHTAPRLPAATYVGVENWLWIPEAQWAVLKKSVTAGATTVAVTATPAQVVWSMGPKAVTCYAPGKAWTPGMTDAAETACSFTYTESSEGEPEGVFEIGAVIRYQVTWTCTGTCLTASGDLGLVDAPAGSAALRVLQRQTVVVQ